MRWSLISLLLVLVLAGSLYAQQPVYCPIEITKGDVWIDKFTLYVRNTGNGVAHGIQIMNSYPVVSPPNPLGGGREAAIMTNNFSLIERLGPGDDVKVLAPANYRGDSWSAKVEACLPR